MLNSQLLLQKNRALQICLVVILLIVALAGYTKVHVSAAAQTAHLWIDGSSSGSCTRSGTPITYAEATASSPSKTCSSFQAAVNKTVNGSADTIVVHGGNTTAYNASLTGVTRNPSVTIYAESGTVAKTNYPTFTAMSGVTIDGTTGANEQGFASSSGMGVGANGAAAAQKLKISGYKLSGMLFMESCDTVEFHHIEITNVVNDDGIQMSTWGDLTHPCNNVIFDHMYIHDLSARCGVDHQDGIQIRGGSHILFKNSKIVNLTNCGSQGFFANQQGDLGGNDTTLENTVISAINGNAINFSSNPPQIMLNNTIDGGLNSCDINKQSGDGACPTTKGVTMKNNILNAACAGVNLYYNRIDSTTGWANNLLTSNCGHGDGVASNFNALFVNPAGSTSDAIDFHLKSTAATAIDKGTINGCPATDADDNARPAGAACDAGAYEFGSSPGGGGGTGATYHTADLNNLLNHYGTPTGMTTSTGDLNGDGATNILDLGVLLNDYSS